MYSNNGRGNITLLMAIYLSLFSTLLMTLYHQTTAMERQLAWFGNNLKLSIGFYRHWHGLSNIDKNALLTQAQSLMAVTDDHFPDCNLNQSGSSQTATIIRQLRRVDTIKQLEVYNLSVCSQGGLGTLTVQANYQFVLADDKKESKTLQTQLLNFHMESI